MKKSLFILLLLLGLFTLCGCNDEKIIPKAEYHLNEKAMIDDTYLTLTKATFKDNILEVVFEITNKTKNTITLNPNTNFKLYDINKVEVKNIYSNSNNIVKKNATITYTLQYIISEKEIYDIYYYSGIVENSKKFTITSEDLK